MTAHHDGDGCTGGVRDLQPGEPREVGDLAVEMMLGVARRDYAATIAAGRHVGLHYGARGEYLLAVQLAVQITGMAPTGHRNAHDVPHLPTALGLRDGQVLDMLRFLADFLHTTRDALDTDLFAALDESAEKVQDFITTVHAHDKADAIKVWSRMYGPDHDKHNERSHLLRAAAVSCLLTVWATRYSVLGHTHVG